jgi:hypothetical protein
MEQQGIYREEVYAIIGGLADVKSGVLQLLRYIEEEDDGEEEEEEDLPDA